MGVIVWYLKCHVNSLAQLLVMYAKKLLVNYVSFCNCSERPRDSKKNFVMDIDKPFRLNGVLWNVAWNLWADPGAICNVDDCHPHFREKQTSRHIASLHATIRSKLPDIPSVWKDQYMGDELHPTGAIFRSMITRSSLRPPQMWIWKTRLIKLRECLAASHWKIESLILRLHISERENIG